MATSRSRPGHHSFRRHLSELELAVTDPGRLAVELYSIGLIDRVARQRASLGSVVSVERSRGAVILDFILCWCLKCCFSCCCTRLRAIITIIFVTILVVIWVHFASIHLFLSSFSVLPLNSKTKCVRCQLPHLNTAVDLRWPALCLLDTGISTCTAVDLLSYT